MSGIDGSIPVNFRQLEVLRLFARTKSVTETARLLRISQPAVSQTLKDIEIQLGFPVFVRERGRTRLTAEVMGLQPEMDRVFADLVLLRNKAEQLRDARAGSLVVATVTTLTGAILPDTIATFRREREQVRIRMDVYPAGEVVRSVLQEFADVGFAFLPIDDTGIGVHPILEVPFICLLPDGHALADRTSVNIADLSSQMLIAHGMNSPPGIMLRETVGPQVVDALNLLETNQSSSALHLVLAGVAPALSHPLVLAFDTSQKITAVPFEPDIKLTLAMLYPRARPIPRIVQRFERILRQQLHLYAEQMAARGLHCRVLA